MCQNQDFVKTVNSPENKPPSKRKKYQQWSKKMKMSTTSHPMKKTCTYPLDGKSMTEMSSIQKRRTSSWALLPS